MCWRSIVIPRGVGQLALEDVSAFLNHHWAEIPRGDGIMQKAVAESNLRLGTVIGNGVPPSEARGDILDALEGHRRYPLEDASGMLKVEHVAELNEIHALISALQCWLDRMDSPSCRFNGELHKAPRVDLYCDYIMLQRVATAHTPMVLNIVPKVEGIDFGGFCSWLFVRIEDNLASLVICYDDTAIKESSSDKWLVENRYARYKLHELGHARLDLAHWTAHPGDQTFALPVHETRAWYYANTVCNLISSLRSRVDRLLR